jgi:hypothetical protein
LGEAIGARWQGHDKMGQTGSPFTGIVIVPSAPYGPRSTATGAGLTQLSNIYEPATFVIQAYDRFGNKRTESYCRPTEQNVVPKCAVGQAGAAFSLQVFQTASGSDTARTGTMDAGTGVYTSCADLASCEDVCLGSVNKQVRIDPVTPPPNNQRSRRQARSSLNELRKRKNSEPADVARRPSTRPSRTPARPRPRASQRAASGTPRRAPACSCAPR